MHLKHIRPVLLFLGLLILAIAIVIMINQTFKRQVPSIVVPQQTEEAQFKLSSLAFKAGAAIPNLYTCLGENISPPLAIENPPENTEEFVIIAKDSNDNAEDKVHWLIWNIPATTTSMLEQTIPEGAVQGTSDDGKQTYSGPCPAVGTKSNFTFEIFALNDHITLAPEATYDTVVSAMNGKVITRTILVGTSQHPTQ